MKIDMIDNFGNFLHKNYKKQYIHTIVFYFTAQALQDFHSTFCSLH